MASNWVVKQIQDGWPMISKAPLLFFVVFVIGAIASFFVVDWHYGGICDSKDSTIKELETKKGSLEADVEKLQKQLKNTKAIIKSTKNEIIEPDISVKKAKKTARIKHKTLHDCFESDFGLLAVRSSVKLSKPNSNEIVTIEYKLNMDSVSNSKFISYYIPLFPSSAKTYENILALINAHLVAFDHVGNKYTIDSHSLGDSSYDYSKNLKFSGKVYVYHAGRLTLEQKAEIARQYEDNGLVLQLRDQDYAVIQNLSAVN